MMKKCEICGKNNPLLEFKDFPVCLEDDREDWIEDATGGYLLVCLDCVIKELMEVCPDNWAVELFRSISRVDENMVFSFKEVKNDNL